MDARIKHLNLVFEAFQLSSSWKQHAISPASSGLMIKFIPHTSTPFFVANRSYTVDESCMNSEKNRSLESSKQGNDGCTGSAPFYTGAG